MPWLLALLWLSIYWRWWLPITVPMGLAWWLEIGNEAVIRGVVPPILALIGMALIVLVRARALPSQAGLAVNPRWGGAWQGEQVFGSSLDKDCDDDECHDEQDEAGARSEGSDDGWW